MIAPRKRPRKTTKSSKKPAASRRSSNGNGKKTDGRPRGDYDGAKPTNRRRAPRTITRSEDSVLSSTDRKALVATARDMRRNFSVAAWAVRKHLDYVSSFSFQARTGDEDLNRRIEELVEWWSEPENCDVAGRHPLARMIRIAEASRTLDGDVLLSRLKTGRLQGIEGDRCRSGLGLPPEAEGKKIVQGVEVTDQNRAIAYYIYSRGRHGLSLTFEKRLPASFVHLLGYFDRFDQVRGISPMAPAINTFRDLYESLDYALAKAKIGQLFGLITFRGDPNSITDPNESGHEDKDGNPRYEVDFGLGPYHLDLDDGDRAEILESKTPSSEFQKYTQETIGLGLKALDIPYSFYNESFTNFSGARQAWLMYDQSAKSKRSDLRHLLNRVTRWKLAQWTAVGLLELPAGMDLRSLRWEWIPTGIPWIDPLKEVLADIEAIKLGLTSRSRVIKRRGEDFLEIAKELGFENLTMIDHGLPPYGPEGIPAPAGLWKIANEEEKEGPE